jgi:hypothetical protein
VTSVTANYTPAIPVGSLRDSTDGRQRAKIVNMSAQAMAAHHASEMRNSQVSRVMIL